MANPATRVALITLARATFDVGFAREIRSRALAALSALDDVGVIECGELLIAPADAAMVAQQLAAERPDLLIIQNGTFALGSLALDLAQATDAPILLWAVPEPGMDGGALRSNSLVGLNLNASNLRKFGRRPRYIYGNPEDPATQDELRRSCRVAGLLRRLEQSRIGLLGSHAMGFYNLAVDPFALRRQFGVRFDSIGLEEAFAQARGLGEQETTAARAQLEALYPVRQEVTAGGLDLMARQFGGLRKLIADRQLDGLALRCWPEWAADYGIAACGSVSALNSMGLITGCEGDVDGTVTMMAGKMLSRQAPFLADFIAADRETNLAHFWHGGCAAAELAAEPGQRALHSHFAGGKGITAGFTLRPGRVTVFRISSLNGTYRLFVEGGEALATEPLVKGALMKLRFDRPVDQILDLIVEHGIEHHYCVIYGDYAADLLALAHWKQLSVIH